MSFSFCNLFPIFLLSFSYFSFLQFVRSLIFPFFISISTRSFYFCCHFHHSTFSTFLSWGLLAYQQKWSAPLAVEIQPTVTRPIRPFPVSLNLFLSRTATVIPYVFKQSEKSIPLIIVPAKNHFLLPYFPANLPIPP